MGREENIFLRFLLLEVPRVHFCFLRKLETASIARYTITTGFRIFPMFSHVISRGFTF